MSNKKSEYRLTAYACFTGIFIQAIIINITAILFVPFMNLYGLSYVHLGMLVAINFTAQVISDLIFSNIIDKLGFKKLVIPAVVLSFTGLLLYALTPYIFKDFLTGIITATVIFSIAGGLLEVLLSPIVNAIPNEEKGPAMALMHSFYAWGQLATIVFTTLFIFIFGQENWQFIVIIWAIIPLINLIMFLNAKYPQVIHETHRMGIRKLIFKPFCMIALMAILFGAATEVIMNQWASTFMEKVMLMPKVTGDLLGMSIFALMLGLGRMLYGKYGQKVNINNILIYGSFISIICYITVALSPINILNFIACAVCGFTVSLLWPGTLVITAEKYPLAGSWIFAFLAAFGDIGAAVGPFLTGLITELTVLSGNLSEPMGIRLGILFGAIFPFMALICHKSLKKRMNMPEKL